MLDKGPYGLKVLLPINAIVKRAFGDKNLKITSDNFSKHWQIIRVLSESKSTLSLGCLFNVRSLLKFPFEQGAWYHSRPCDVWRFTTHWPPSCWLDQVISDFQFTSCDLYCSGQGSMDKHHHGWSTFWSNEHPQHNQQGSGTFAHNRGSFSIFIWSKHLIQFEDIFLARWLVWTMNLMDLTMDHFLNAENKLDLSWPHLATNCQWSWSMVLSIGCTSGLGSLTSPNFGARLDRSQSLFYFVPQSNWLDYARSTKQ